MKRPAVLAAELREVGAMLDARRDASETAAQVMRRPRRLSVGLVIALAMCAIAAAA